MAVQGDFCNRAQLLGLDADILKELQDGGGPTPSVAWGDITGKPTTFPPVTGVTEDTAKPGNYLPPWGDLQAIPEFIDDIAGASTAAEVRTAIGAGTSSLELGNTSSTALAGDGKSLTSALADEAIKLQTGRTITLTGGSTGVSATFDGSADASIAVTLATPTSSVRGGVTQHAALPNVSNPPTQAEVQAIIDALVAIGAFAS